MPGLVCFLLNRRSFGAKPVFLHVPSPQVTVYGDGTGDPLTLRDWSLVDFDYLKDQGEKYSTPHCVLESIHPLAQKIKE